MDRRQLALLGSSVAPALIEGEQAAPGTLAVGLISRAGVSTETPAIFQSECLRAPASVVAKERSERLAGVPVDDRTGTDAELSAAGRLGPEILHVNVDRPPEACALHR